MNENQRKAGMLSAIAEIFNFRFTENVAAIYLAVLKDLSSDDLASAIEVGMKSNRWQFMPKPGEFLNKNPTEILDDSRDVAILAWAAIAKRGRHNAEQARADIGELGWAVIQRMGGWSAICNVNSDERTMFLAQFRDTAQSLARKAERNELHVKPALPQPRHNLDGMVKKLAERLGAPAKAF